MPEPMSRNFPPFKDWSPVLWSFTHFEFHYFAFDGQFSHQHFLKIILSLCVFLVLLWKSIKKIKNITTTWFNNSISWCISKRMEIRTWRNTCLPCSL
jgi:uncharacterized membrane protein YfhO